MAYQIEENGYHGRSFEDAFISVNIDNLRTKKADLQGLKKKEILDTDTDDYYQLTKDILQEKGKSAFASSLLFEALTDEKLNWNMPLYIKEGLAWIAKSH